MEVGKPSSFTEGAKSTHMSPDYGPAANNCLSVGPDAIPAHEKTKIFPESIFFTENRAAALPKPDEMRAINKATGEFRATLFNRPLPVKLESLGLFVKYGADVGPVEAQTQVLVREKLQGRVPVPEVYGWTEDGGQKFIYMELIQGDTLEERWRGMTEPERLVVCEELKDMVSTWRELGQKDDGDREHPYIGILFARSLR